MAKTWRQKFDARMDTEVVTLEKPMPGVPAGSRLLISTPTKIAAAVAAIPKGSKQSIIDLREQLAKEAGADATCAMTTGIFLRIAAEVALEDLASGKEEVTPFWRVVEPKSPLAKKLSCGPEWIAQQRAAEGIH